MDKSKSDREAAARERRRLRKEAAAGALKAGYDGEHQPVDPYIAVAEAVADPDLRGASDEFVPRFLRDSWRKHGG